MNTTGRGRLRGRLARAALTAFAVSAFALVWLLVAMLYSQDFATDFENGTHLYRGGEPMPYLALVAAVSLAVGCFGTGRAAVWCRVILGGMAGLFVGFIALVTL